MLRLEEWMELQSLYQCGMSVSEIARDAGLDRKTVRKYLHQAREPYQRPPRPLKVESY